MKKLKLLIFILLIFMTSCSSNNFKDEAYCFSMVFEKIGGKPNVTMYCKIQNKDDTSKLSDSSFTFGATSLKDAVLSADNSDYEIYFSSTKAIYFSQDITNEEIYEIMVYFLNHAKYQSSVYVYTSQDANKKDTILQKREAEEVCRNEKINYTKQQDYTFSVKAIRDIYGK